MRSFPLISLAGCLVAASLPAFAGPVAVPAAKAPIQITADLTEAGRKLYHAEIEIPVVAGPVTLVSPKWIPGTHMPAGPVDNITGLVFTAGGKTLEWRRDDVDLYAFHMTVPAGVTSLHVHLDAIVTNRVTQKIAVLEWERLLLYPAGIATREIAIEPAVKVAAGWGVGTALTPVDAPGWPVPAAGAVTKFSVTNVEQLEDSPVIAGANFHEYALAPEVSPKHYLDVVADEAEGANLRPAFLAEVGNLVREADAMYASHHYGVYHFLLTLSDVAGGEGLEHGQSSDNGVGEKGFADAEHQVPNADLLGHEFTHSWNGKYRRPAGLYQPDFATPQQGALLWVYEGMTQYLGNVLATRSGLRTQEQLRDDIAFQAALLDTTAGRKWRSTGDTAVAASVLRQSGAWGNWRRGQDYYMEGYLLWLDVDTEIRSLTEDRKSIDDFEKVFLGLGGNTGPTIVPYTLDEIVKDLNQVAPYDWAKFLHERVDRVNPRVDTEGIERGGYRLVYKPTRTSYEKTLLSDPETDSYMGSEEFWFSLGVMASKDGTIRDVLWASAADQAKLAPGNKILSVNGRAFSGDLLRQAVRNAKGTTEPIHLIVQAESFVRPVDVEYHDGPRYPVLERIEGSAAYLDEVGKARGKDEAIPEEKKGEEE